jgi:outer membrane protein assembly factor BamB
MRYLIFFALCCSFFISSCCDFDVTRLGRSHSAQPKDYSEAEITESLDVVWSIALQPDHSPTWTMGTTMTNNGLLTSRPSYNYPGEHAITMLNPETGETIWTWDEYAEEYNSGPFNTFIMDDELYLNDRHLNYGVDCTSGQTTWQKPLMEGGRDVSVYKNLIFSVQEFGSAPRFDKVAIAYKEKGKGEWQTAFSLTAEEGKNPFVSAPAIYENEVGEIILLMDVAFIYANNHSDSWLYAYNLDQQKMEWTVGDIDPEGSGRKGTPLIDGDYVYHIGTRYLFCRDVRTGALMWERTFEEPYVYFYDDHRVIADDKWILSNSCGEVLAIHKNTGATIWKIDRDRKSHIIPEKFNVFEDRLYFAAGSIYIVNIRTGWIEQTIAPREITSGYRDPEFQGDLHIDFEKGLVYAADKFDILCFEIPEE